MGRSNVMNNDQEAEALRIGGSCCGVSFYSSPSQLRYMSFLANVAYYVLSFWRSVPLPLPLPQCLSLSLSLVLKQQQQTILTMNSGIYVTFCNGEVGQVDLEFSWGSRNPSSGEEGPTSQASHLPFSGDLFWLNHIFLSICMYMPLSVH